MNPILSSDTYIPDAEAHVMPDGKVYLYGSKDNSGDTEFCSTEYKVFSSTNLIDWKDEGIIFNSTDKEYGLGNGLTLGGPDCVYHDKKYYLYYCMYGNRMGVAVSNSPKGPFKNLGKVTPADGTSIDPAVLVDDDGSCYYFWGQFHLRGGRLANDMKTVIPETIQSTILTEHEQGFHEGVSVRKINGLYYLVYADISKGKPHCLAYATSKYPLGPYKKRGILIDNSGYDSGDWNNAGSIEIVNEKPYLFYHRSSQNSIYNRTVCIEPLEINEDGSIEEVKMTSNGVSKYLPYNRWINARNLSHMRMKLPFNSLVQPMALYPLKGNRGCVLSYIKNEDWIQFDNVNFGNKCNKILINIASPKPMRVEFWIENNIKIGKVDISPTGPGWSDFQKIITTINSMSGIHTLWIRFLSRKNSVGRIGDFRSFYIEEV